jgi:hypothetical protein
MDDNSSSLLGASGILAKLALTPLPKKLQEGPSESFAYLCRGLGRCDCDLLLQSESRGLYQDLPSVDHLRILEILPGLGGAVECILHMGRLPEDRYKYEALSYTWDLDSETPRKTPTLPIRCNGLEVFVGVNLANALRRLRRKQVSRMVWADALCINQTNMAEKSQQVSRMNLIYENASQVVIWLGDSGTKCDRPLSYGFDIQSPPHYPYQAFSGVCAVVNAWRARSGYDGSIPAATHSPGLAIPPEETWEIQESSTYKPWRSIPELNDGPLSDVEEWGRIFEIYNRPWFSRLWVVQEVALARSAIVLWDDCEISWEWIGLAAAIIRTNYDAIAAVIQSHPKIHIQSSMHKGIINCYLMFRLSKSQKYIPAIQLTFCELLKLTRHFGCRDDRDRVYGLLGLPTADDISRTLVPDYRDSIAEVFGHVAKKIIGSSLSLTILSSVQRDENHVWYTKNATCDEEKFDPTMPSWVPQWNVLLTRGLTPPHGTGFAASSNTQLQLQHTDDPLKLKVRGILVDSVVKCVYSGDEFRYFIRTVPYTRPAGASQTGNQLQESNHPLKELLQDPQAGQRHLEKISLTLTAGHNWYGIPVEDLSSHLADYLCCLLDGGLWWSLDKDAFTGPNGQDIERTPGLEEKVLLEDLIQCWNFEARVKTGNAKRFLDIATTMADQRARFTTSNGMIGLGPKAMQQDDLLSILYGASVPFIIRPKSDGLGYILIGECYVHDLMSGDAVKHPDLLTSRTLPTEFKTEETWIELH